MNAFELSEKMTAKQALAVVSFWEQNKPVAKANFECLMRLGDSFKLACATVMLEQMKEDNSDFYKKAYEG